MTSSDQLESATVSWIMRTLSAMIHCACKCSYSWKIYFQGLVGLDGWVGVAGWLYQEGRRLTQLFTELKVEAEIIEAIWTV